MNHIFSIDRRKNLSITEQINANLKTYILANSTPPGEKLPNAIDIANEYNINAKDIESYYETLIQEGFVESKDKEYFKSTRLYILDRDDEKNISLSEWLSFAGLESERKTLSIEEGPLLKYKRIQDFEILDNYLKIINLIDFGQNKQAYMIVYVATSILPKNAHALFKDTSITQKLKEFTKDKLKVDRFLSINEAPAEALKTLNINKNTAVLTSYQFMSNDYNELILYSELYTNHESFFTFKKIPYTS